MIRVYLQYSYGGFKTFQIEGQKDEQVNNEITSAASEGFPTEAHCYFQYGGAKMVYRYLSNGQLDLVVREIPSIHKDGDGRSIPCAVQFIGDEDDRKTLDYMAMDIANGLDLFHDFFSNLFRVRNGLRIEGDKLMEWIDAHKAESVCISDVVPIKNISKVTSGVILFVPLSDNYGVDETVTQNVTQELGLPMGLAADKKRYISVRELAKVQGKSSIQPAPKQEETISGDVDNASQNLSDRIVELEKKNAELEKLAKDDFNALKLVNEKSEKHDMQIKSVLAELERHKKLLYVSVGVTALFAVLCGIHILTK